MDSVSEAMRISWDEVFEKNIVEFLNVLCYTRDKAELKKQQIEEYEKKNKIKKY